MKHTISAVIPAFNEGDRIASAVESVKSILRRYEFGWDIIVVNDGSQDQTGKMAEELAIHDKAIRVIHNPQNRGLGYSLRVGINEAKGDYFFWFPGDNSIKRESLEPLFDVLGQREIVIGYMGNLNQRVLLRRCLSKIFTATMNFLFGLSVKYYNGPFIYPTRLVQSLKLSSRGHGIFSEILVRSIKSNHTYIEVPFVHNLETEKRSKALSLKNLLSIIEATFVLFRDIYFCQKPQGT